MLKGYEIDEATSSVSQTCLLSYDNNAYLNKSAEKLTVNSQVDKNYKKAQAEERENVKNYIPNIKRPQTTMRYWKHLIIFQETYVMTIEQT